MTATPTKEVTTPAEDVTSPTDKKSSKTTLIATGAIVLGLLILAAGTGAIVYYAVKKDDDDDHDDDDGDVPVGNNASAENDTPVYVIDQEYATYEGNLIWPNCHGEVFTNPTAKELYSIDVKISDYQNFGSMHVELYIGVVGTNGYIAKSSTKNGQGWTSFDFPTHPTLLSLDCTYTFLIVPENKQDVAVWYTDGANMHSNRRIVYDYTTQGISFATSGSSLTFKLYATV